MNFKGILVTIAQTLFAVTSFYYTVNLLVAYKKEGASEFFKNSWNLVDLLTVLLSIVAIGLYLALTFVLVAGMKNEVRTIKCEYC